MQDQYWLTYAVETFLENFWYVVVATFGAIVGSFLGVVIYRLPIKELTEPDKLPKGYSLSNPPSYCPHCNHQLQWWENVPIFGFLYLGGRCSDCRKPIPWRDFAMEILTTCTWVAIFCRYNGNNPVDWVNVVLLALFASMLIAAVFIDLDHFIVPEDLNWFGIAVSFLRPIIVLGIAYALAHLAVPADWNIHWNGSSIWEDTRDKFTYFGWLPIGFVGAALYGGVLWMVSFLSFIYYAREPWESLGGVTRRFFTYEPAPPPPADADPEMLKEIAEAAAQPAQGPPVRLRFSPGFVTFLSAGFLAYVVGWWGLIVVVLPLIGFILLTRTPAESVADAFRRFFKADDLPYEYDAPSASLAMPTAAPKKTTPKANEPVITGANVRQLVWDRPVGAEDPAVASAIGTPLPPAVDPTVEAIPEPASESPMSFAESQADADEFAKEAEAGAHGGMGLGDVKLAIAIGAILGPAQAMLSLFFAVTLGAGIGGALMFVYQKRGLKFGVPFVPFMAAGAFLTLLFGQQIVVWYSNFYSGNPQPVPGYSADADRYHGPVIPSDSALRRMREERRTQP